MTVHVTVLTLKENKGDWSCPLTTSYKTLTRQLLIDQPL